jgi:hypothetical protein
MTDPHDDLSSVADPGALGPDEMTQPDHESPDERAAQERAAVTPESQAANGAPLGPPD